MRAAPGGAGNWRPRPVDELLLRAVLAGGEETARSWRAWLAGERVEDAEIGCLRLLPTLYRNLAAADDEAPELGRVRGAHRQSWYRNHLVFRAGGELLGLLHRAEVPTLVLKEAALAIAHYEDVGARPIEDLDVLVTPRQAARALAVLREAGWRPPAPLAEDLFAVKHSVGLVRDSPLEGVQLHWRTFPHSAAGEEDLWSDSVALTLGGVPTRTLSPADHLLHVCALGVAWNPVRPIRWVVDATAIIRSAGVRLDWDRFCAHAAKREQVFTARELLGYLQGTFAPEIPPAVIDRLRAMPAGRADRSLHRALVARPPSPRRAWRANRAAHRALAAAPGVPAIGFLDFLAQNWDLGTRRELALHVARKAGGLLRTAP